MEDNSSPPRPKDIRIPLLPITHRKPKSRHGATQTKTVSGSWELSFPERTLQGPGIAAETAAGTRGFTAAPGAPERSKSRFENSPQGEEEEGEKGRESRDNCNRMTIKKS